MVGRPQCDDDEDDAAAAAADDDDTLFTLMCGWPGKRELINVSNGCFLKFAI